MSKVYVLKKTDDIWRIQWVSLSIICVHLNKTYIETETT